MKERPILFSGEMVRALLAGTKTQTRRIVKPQPTWAEAEPNSIACPGWAYANKNNSLVLTKFPDPTVFANALSQYCPHGQKGDQLWVRETTIVAPKRFANPGNSNLRDKDGDERLVQYLATQPDRSAANDYGLRKATPSIFMPRWACRILLEITEIRVERLQDISEDDARAEGITELPDKKGVFDGGGPAMGNTARMAYMRLWDSINWKTHPFASNPWVWAISFQKLNPTTP